jgi:hypothetical protein
MRHPDWTDPRISNSLSRWHISVKEIKLVREGQLVPNALPEKKPDAGGIVKLSKVIERYDVRSAIIRELAKLPRGSLIAESEFCVRAAGTDRNRFRRTVENNADEFRPYRIKLRLEVSSEDKWYWGHPEDIAEAQRIKEL